ncbi:hypothetical protein K435DRAFT_849408 [Dendrothele bispora CBS 962.96]|uniref:Uncharacterized protein n=1 Tax=Dendrothele bispora (strain CBS 962.96) TaxID=1314807 RepID=A0A4S8MSK1_DENBC|nr:hypothetical protein K435DRAFT_849408 [Dendrothele bispora CBS 962.96]
MPRNKQQRTDVDIDEDYILSSSDTLALHILHEDTLNGRMIRNKILLFDLPSLTQNDPGRDEQESKIIQTMEDFEAFQTKMNSLDFVEDGEFEVEIPNLAKAAENQGPNVDESNPVKVQASRGDPKCYIWMDVVMPFIKPDVRPVKYP